MSQTPTIPQVIIEQLGGNQFIAMTGTHSFRFSKKDHSLTMNLTANKAKATWLRITLTPLDLYKMEFLKREPIKSASFPFSIVAEYDMVYGDMLAGIFTDVTGLYTTLYP